MKEAELPAKWQILAAAVEVLEEKGLIDRPEAVGMKSMIEGLCGAKGFAGWERGGGNFV